MVFDRTKYYRERYQNDPRHREYMKRVNREHQRAIYGKGISWKEKNPELYWEYQKRYRARHRNTLLNKILDILHIK